MAQTVHHHDALEALKGYIDWPLDLDVDGPAQAVPIELLRAVVAEFEQLRAERAPFKTVLDEAMHERGWPNQPMPAGVIDLAERLGLRARELKVGSDLIVEHGFIGRCEGKVATIRAPSGPARRRPAVFRIEVLPETSADDEPRTPSFIDLASRDLAQLADLGELVQYMGRWCVITEHSGTDVRGEAFRASLHLMEVR